MNEFVMQTIRGYIQAFDAYKVDSPTLQAKINDFKDRLIAFGEANNDITAFYNNLAQSGLQEEYMSLITRVAMADSGAAGADGQVKNDYSQDDPTPLPTVKEFLEQYRASYDEIRRAGGRKNGEAAYEKLFDVANRTDDLVEAQLIIERERLLWHIVKDDALDIDRNKLAELDPLYLATTAALKAHIEAFEKSQSDEELSYHLEKMELGVRQVVMDYTNKMYFAATLATLLIKYDKAKSEAYDMNPIKLKGAVKAMLLLRRALRRTLACMYRQVGMSFDDLLADEGAKIWLLNPQNIDTYGRTKKAMHPQNYEAFREIINEEILPDISLADVLRRKANYVIWLR